MKSYHYILIIFIAVFAGYAGAYLAGGNSKTSPEIKRETAYERILRTGVLRCGYALWPPIVLNKDPNTGEITGIGKDIIEEAAKNLSLKVEWVEEGGWGSYVASLQSRRFDVFCATAAQHASKGRETRYTIPLFMTPVYAYARIDDDRFDSGLDILNDPAYRISGQDGEISEFIARAHYPKATYVGQQQLSELGQIFMDVATRKADVVFNAPDVAEDFMKHNPGKLKRISNEPFETYTVGYAVTMSENNLKQMLDNALVQLHNNGMIEKILSKYNAKPDYFLRVAKPYQIAKD